MKAKKKRDNNKRTRNKMLSIRMTQQEKELLNRACEKSELSIIDTIVQLLEGYLG